MKSALILSILLSLSALAGEPPKSTPNSPKKSLPSTQIYEHEDEEVSFEAVVKIVREVQGEMDVFFEGKPGFFVVSSNEMQQLLVRSQKKKMPVHIRANPTSRQILKVDLTAPDKD